MKNVTRQQTDAEVTHPSRTLPGTSATTRVPNGTTRSSVTTTGRGNCTRSKFRSYKNDPHHLLNKLRSRSFGLSETAVDRRMTVDHRRPRKCTICCILSVNILLTDLVLAKGKTKSQLTDIVSQPHQYFSTTF